VLVLTGMTWLTAAGNLAATGTRIADLEASREALGERRARALISHAAATDPRRLETRANELGFGPPEAVEFVPVTLPGPGTEAQVVRGDSPLGVFLARDGEHVPALAAAAHEIGAVLVASQEPAYGQPPGTDAVALASGADAP
jgi:hypothetical protein